MALNDPYVLAEESLSSGGDFILPGASAGTGAAEIVEIGGTAEADIYKETDVDGDGTFELTVRVDSTTGSWHSQLNQFIVSDSDNHRLRINNASSGAGDFYGTGIEVND